DGDTHVGHIAPFRITGSNHDRRQLVVDFAEPRPAVGADHCRAAVLRTGHELLARLLQLSALPEALGFLVGRDAGLLVGAQSRYVAGRYHERREAHHEERSVEKPPPPYRHSTLKCLMPCESMV